MTDSKRMDVHEALHEVRVQKERLEDEVRTKTDLCNSLKRSQNELITKFQEAKVQSEKQAQELSTKTDLCNTLDIWLMTIAVCLCSFHLLTYLCIFSYNFGYLFV